MEAVLKETGTSIGHCLGIRAFRPGNCGLVTDFYGTLSGRPYTTDEALGRKLGVMGTWSNETNEALG